LRSPRCQAVRLVNSQSDSISPPDYGGSQMKKSKLQIRDLASKKGSIKTLADEQIRLVVGGRDTTGGTTSDSSDTDVAEVLRARGAQLAWVCHREYPAHANVSLRFDKGRPHIRWRNGDADLDLSDLTAIWHRRPYMPRVDDQLTTPALRAAIVEDSDLFLRDLWNATDCLTVPAPSLVYRRADLKASQLAAALRLGLETPDTLITNDPAALLDCYRAHDGPVEVSMGGPETMRACVESMTRTMEAMQRAQVERERALAQKDRALTDAQVAMQRCHTDLLIALLDRTTTKPQDALAVVKQQIASSSIWASRWSSRSTALASITRRR
jgi:hypothetical protein